MGLENMPSQQADAQIQRQTDWVPVDPPELTKDKKIHRGNASRSAQRLFRGLDALGLQFTEQYKVTGTDLPLLPKSSRGEYNIVLLESIAEIPHAILFPLDRNELILDSTHDWKGNSFYSIEANIDYNSHPFRMFMDVEPKGYEKFRLSLVTSTHIPQEREISLDLLPLDFRSVGFRYDFLRNPEHRKRLSEFYERRLDMDMVSGDPRTQSAMFGRQTPNGITAVSRLYLQTPNPNRYLKCYEVELFGEESGQGRKRFLDSTEEIVPESHWQEDERHYCMTGDKETSTYPLFPIEELDLVSTLSMEIHYDDKSDDPTLVHELLRGFPLSIGTNQWYATGYLGDGNVELLSKPEWGYDNARLVYHQKAKKRITPKEIHSAVVGLNALRTAITERLAT